MTRLSKIERLPEVHEKLAAWRAGGLTTDAIIAAVRAEFPDLPEDALPARSGFIRAVRRIDEIAAEARKRREIAIALAPRTGELAPQMRHVIEALITAAADVLEGAETGSVDPKSLHDLAKAMDHAARAGKSMATTPADPAPAAAPAAPQAAPAPAPAGEDVVARQARRIMGFEP